MQKRTSQLAAKESEVRKSLNPGWDRAPCWGQRSAAAQHNAPKLLEVTELGISWKDYFCRIFMLIPASPKPQVQHPHARAGHQQRGARGRSSRALPTNPFLLSESLNKSHREKPKPRFRS